MAMSPYDVNKARKKPLDEIWAVLVLVPMLLAFLTVQVSKGLYRVITKKVNFL